MLTLEPGFPAKGNIAEADARYLHRYNYCTAHNGWIIITQAVRAFGTNSWAFRLVDPEFGEPFGDTIRSSIDLWADRFADRPFDVEAPVEDQRAWFARIAKSATYSPSRFDAMYTGYVERLAYCSSYAALLRVGAIPSAARAQLADTLGLNPFI